MSVCCFDLLPSVCHCHLQLFAVQFDVPVINKIKIGNSYLASLHNFHFQKQSWSTPKSDYCEIRCIALRVLQTSRGFWVFQFRQSFEGRGRRGGGGVNANRKELNALARLGTQKQNWHETENDFWLLKNYSQENPFEDCFFAIRHLIGIRDSAISRRQIWEMLFCKEKWRGSLQLVIIHSEEKESTGTHHLKW